MRKLLVSSCFLFIAVTGFGQPMAGTYTIGGAGASFATISAAMAALSTNGVNGPVTFNIAPGNYQEKLNMLAVNGVSSANTILFQSATLDSSDVIINDSSSSTSVDNFTLCVNGVGYTTFRHLTFVRTGNLDYSRVVDIINGSNYITFYHNRFIGPPTTSSALYKSVVHGANSSSQSNLTFEGNLFENGSYGLYLVGISQLICCIDHGNKVISNRMVNQYFCGLYLQSQWGPLVTGNVIESSSTANGYGIYTFYADNDMKILKNRISVINGKGIYIHNTSIAGIPTNLIANNFVAVGGSGNGDGISIENSQSCNIYYNSVHLYNTSSVSACIRFNGINTGFNEMINNQMVNTGGGYSLYVTSATNAPLTVSDYNNLFTSGSLTGFWQSAGNQATLADYRTASGYEFHSIAMDPVFVSSTDLHCQSLPMDNLGTSSLSSSTPVTDDIDDEARDFTAPDIGADEYSVADLALVYVDTLHSLCEGQVPLLLVRIANELTLNFNDTVLIGFSFSGQPFFVQHYPLALLPGDTADLYLTGPDPVPAAGQAILNVFLAHPWDIDPSNDSLSMPFSIDPPFVVDLGTDLILCTNQGQMIIPAGSFQSCLWHDSTTAFTWFADGTLMTPGLYDIWIQALNDRHCIASDSLQITVHPHPVPHINVTPSFTGYVGTDTLTIVCHMFANTFRCGYFETYWWNNQSADSFITTPPYTLPLGLNQSFVMVTNLFGCTGTDSLVYYVDDCQNIIEDNHETDLYIQPNPSGDGIFYLNTGSGRLPSELRIFNINGEVLENQGIECLSDGYTRIDLGAQSRGIYLLQFLIDSTLYHKKLLKL